MRVDGEDAESNSKPTSETEPEGLASKLTQRPTEVHTLTLNFSGIQLQPASLVPSLVELSAAERDSLLALLDGPLFPFDSGDPGMSSHETETWNTLNNSTAPTPSSWMFPSPGLFPPSQHQLLWPPMSTPQMYPSSQPFIMSQGTPSAIPAGFPNLNTQLAMPTPPHGSNVSIAVASPPTAMTSPTSCPGTSPISILDMNSSGMGGSPGSELSGVQVATVSPSAAVLSLLIPQASWAVPATTLATVVPATQAVTSTESKGNKRKATQLAEHTESCTTVKTTTPMLIPPATKKAKKGKEKKGGASSDGNLRRSGRQPKAAPLMAPTCIADPKAPLPGK